MLNPVFLFASFDGRIGRMDFWCGLGGLVAGFGAISFLTVFLPKMAGNFVQGACYASAVYPLAALMAKRLADRGKDVEYLWAMLGVPVAASLYAMFQRPHADDPVALFLSALYMLVAIWATIELGLLPGTRAAGAFSRASREIRR